MKRCRSMSTNRITKKGFLILSFGIFISGLLHTSSASSLDDYLQDPASSAEYAEVQKILRDWDPSTDFIADRSLEKSKKNINFYIARGKMSLSEDAGEENSDSISDFDMDGEQEEAIVFFPKRGRRAMHFALMRGRRGGEPIPMPVQQVDGASDAKGSYWKYAVDSENNASSFPEHPEDSENFRDMELTLTQEFDKGDDHIFADGSDTNGQALFGMKGKIGRFPVVNEGSSFRNFQRAANPIGTRKSRQKFIPKRGKRKEVIRCRKAIVQGS